MLFGRITIYKWLVKKLKMADDLTNLFDQFDEIFPTTERVFLPLANPFDDQSGRQEVQAAFPALKEHRAICLVDEIIDSNC